MKKLALLFVLISFVYSQTCLHCGLYPAFTGKITSGGNKEMRCPNGHISYERSPTNNTYNRPSNSGSDLNNALKSANKMMKEANIKREKKAQQSLQIMQMARENIRYKEQKEIQKQTELTNQLNSAVPISGSSDERSQITERWPNGLKKTVFIMKGTGLNETITKYGFGEDGKPLYIEKPSIDWRYNYGYHENGNINSEGATNGSIDGKYIMIGLWIDYYESGNKFSERNLSGTKEDPWRKVGPYTNWFENGQISEQGTYNDVGLKDGLITNWYENGNKIESYYKDDKRHGLTKIWNEDGNILFEGNYKDGKQNGLFVQWYENGNKSQEENFKDGKQDGLFVQWYENGSKKGEVNIKDDKQDGLFVEWYENGNKYREVNFKDGKEDGLFVEWYENGNKYGEYNFKDGKQDGLFVQWYENGNKSHEVNFKDGKEDGLFKYWHKNGNKYREVNFKDGKEDGLFVEWYENGDKYREYNFKDGKDHGSFKYWHENGNIAFENKFNHGVQISRRMDYDEEGNERDGQWTKILSNKSKIVGVSKKGRANGEFNYYDSNGDLIKTKVYKNGFLHGNSKEKNDEGKWTIEKWRYGKIISTNTDS